MRKLKMTIGPVTIHAELFDTPTADAIYAAAPFEARATTWGDEVYFQAPVKLDREPGARDVVEPGEVAFRTEGEAIVIGWGPTPASEGEEIRLASPSNVWARVVEDVRRLGHVEAGDAIRVEALVE